MIESGDSENIFQKAILEQVRKQPWFQLAAHLG